MERFGGVQEECVGSCGEQCCGDFAGDEAAFADSGEDGLLASFCCRGKEGGDGFKGFLLRAFEALGERFESGGFDADEACGAVGVLLHGTR